MSLNIIVASYPGKCQYNSKRCYDDIDKTLIKNLINLSKYKLHNPKSQITLMKAYDNYNPENVLECPYYNYPKDLFNNHNFKVYSVCNEYFSMGQWLKCYDANKNFDYYMFVEDDYTPCREGYDQIIIDMYKEQFPDNIGVLGNIVLNEPVVHWDGVMVVSRETLELVHSLGDIFKRFHNHLGRFGGDRFNGGQCQLAFSTMFSEIPGISFKSMLYKHNFIFWCDNKHGNTIHIFIDDQEDRTLLPFKSLDIHSIRPYLENSIILPIQLLGL
uniref:Glycosyltransferase 2-like domain-containing protein n=1 Tax=viral metagenome TaxID=1070528 RepID=A0A6C0CJH2_9ZZZZ